jgi:hypothetical protein
VPWKALGLTVLTLAGIGAYEQFSTPKTTVITETAQPGDNPSTLVAKAEHKLHHDLDDPSIARFASEEAWKIQQDHPVIHVGDVLKVRAK